MENWNKWKTCPHNFQPVAKFSEFGLVHQDECTECGCIGVLADKPDENGFYQIVAQPMAEVIDFMEFKRRKEQANEQEQNAVLNGN